MKNLLPISFLLILLVACNVTKQDYSGNWCIKEIIFEDRSKKIADRKENDFILQLNNDSTYKITYDGMGSIWMPFNGSWMIRNDSLFVDKEKFKIISLLANELTLGGENNCKIILTRN